MTSDIKPLGSYCCFVKNKGPKVKFGDSRVLEHWLTYLAEALRPLLLASFSATWMGVSNDFIQLIWSGASTGTKFSPGEVRTRRELLGLIWINRSHEY